MEKEHINNSDGKAFDGSRSYPSWCKSDAARFVWEQSQLGFYRHDGSFDIDKMEFIKEILLGVTKDELDMLSTSDEVAECLRFRAHEVRLRYHEEGLKKEGETIDELIEKYLDFNENEPFRSIDAREELQERFKYQSHSDQIKIIRAFLEDDDDVSREWCYETMKQRWDDCLIPVVQTVWETYKEDACATVVAQRFPLEYVIKHMEELEKADYASVCLRLGVNEEDCFIGDLTRKEYLTLAVHNDWHIDDEEADELLFGFILDILDNESDSASVIGLGKTDDLTGRFYYIQGKTLMPSSYREPSLLHIVDMPFYIEALAKLGKIFTLKKLYEWDLVLKHMLKTWLSSPYDNGDIIRELSNGYDACLKQMWKRFMIGASNTFPFGNVFNGKEYFRKTHDKFHFKKQERKEYYPGYSWEEGMAF